MTSLFTGRNIAVHYNHSAELLAVREINPTTGEPGPHLAVTDRIILRNAFFSSREDQWKQVQSGDLSISKQTGEIKGTIIDESGQVPDEAQRVYYTPKERHDFHLENGRKVYCADVVYIDGNEVYALNPQ